MAFSHNFPNQQQKRVNVREQKIEMRKVFREKRASLDADIDRVLGEIMALLGDKE